MFNAQLFNKPFFFQLIQSGGNVFNFGVFQFIGSKKQASPVTETHKKALSIF